MLLKYFYDKALAHASYMVGCQRSGSAIIVDPGRDIDQYLDAAQSEGLEVSAVAETHIHADYVSGARELAERVGAKLYVSDEGPAEWKYGYLENYEHQLLRDGDSFRLGKIRFDVLHTPGHTPESISFVLTDEGGGADKPMGIFTGDFVFVGSIGRPDLLEEAAGIADTAEPGARDLYRSVQKFLDLPDHLQVWPAHGAGSACGKGLGAIPSSTVGYEKLFNPALQFTSEDAFVDYILADQPDAPTYFAVMKRVNKEGPRLVGDDDFQRICSVDELPDALERGTVIDLSPAKAFAAGHVPGTINIPLKMLANWAGWLLDYERPVYLISELHELNEAVRILRKIGVEDIAGVFSPESINRAELRTQQYATGTPADLQHSIESGQVKLVDVRSEAEWKSGHIAEASHHFLGRLPNTLDELPADKTIVTQCQSGARSSIAASVLQAAGFDVINLTGGMNRWSDEGCPIERESATAESCEVRSGGCQ